MGSFAKRFSGGLFGASVAAITMAISTAAWAEPREFNVPAEDAVQAIPEFARQAGVQIVAPSAQLRGVQTPAVRGTMEPREALRQLLQGTGLEVASDDGRIITLRTVSPTQLGAAEASSDEEITVVGTRIRGAAPVGSEVISMDREDIDRAGYGNVQQLMGNLPQNFVGGLSEQSVGQSSSRNGNSNNFAQGAGINLRGLGNSSTLVLLDGRRIVSGGIGDSVDVSMLPLGAIERVDVLADGASAIYGSDAVGGVVNFVLRRDYSGAETRLRYGNITNGDSEERQLQQLFGTTWAGGHFIASYEHYDRGRLDASARDYPSADLTNNGTIPSNLLPSINRDSLFASTSLDVSDNARLFGTAYYSRRHSENEVYNPGFAQRGHYENDIDLYGGTAGVSFDLGATWQAEFSSTFSESESQDNFASNGVPDPRITTDTTSWSVDGKADGVLGHLPGGDIRLAVGGQFRRETMSRFINPRDVSLDRDISAAFAELYLPLIGDDNATPWARQLTLSIAGRYEDYSDFGSTTNPKLGLLWSPLEGLNFRGSWGTSFRAPILFETDTGRVTGLMLDLPDPGAPSGTSSILFLFRGAVPNLGPETATTWTAGFDFEPPSLPGLRTSLTYFNVDYSDRIGTIDGGVGYSAILNPAPFLALLSRPADPTLIALAGSLPTGFFEGQFFNLSADALADAEVSVDNRLRNLASTEVDGLDFSIQYDHELSSGSTLRLGLSANYLFHYDNRATPGSPTTSVLNTTYNPIDFRARGTLGFSAGPWDATAFVNYTNSYTNNQVTPSQGIDAWTTVDLSLSFDTSRLSHSPIGDAVIALNVINAFNEDPPFVQDFGSYGNAGYDAQNANPLGRLVALQVTKRW